MPDESAASEWNKKVAFSINAQQISFFKNIGIKKKKFPFQGLTVEFLILTIRVWLPCFCHDFRPSWCILDKRGMFFFFGSVSLNWTFVYRGVYICSYTKELKSVLLSPKTPTMVPMIKQKQFFSAALDIWAGLFLIHLYLFI